MKRKAHQGQSTVEFALVLPILALLLFIIVQLGFAFNAYVTIVHTAREVAREAAISNTELTTGAIGTLIKTRLESSSPPLRGAIANTSTYTGEKNKDRKVEVKFTYTFTTGLEPVLSGVMKLVDPGSSGVSGGIPLKTSAVMAVQ